MRILTLLLLFSGAVSAAEITLSKGQIYTVPKGKVWVVENAQVAECRVCTADVYTKGGLNNIQVGGVTFSGEFNFSFSSVQNGPIKMYPGTQISLGDSRSSLIINEQDL